MELRGVPESRRSRRVGHPHDLVRQLSDRGVVYYRVLETNPPSDMRSTGRRKCRLQSGKVLDLAGRFICECLVHDRSAGGIRLQVKPGLQIPCRFLLFDDASDSLKAGLVVWRNKATLGIRLIECSDFRLKRSMGTALRDGFYAVRD